MSELVDVPRQVSFLGFDRRTGVVSDQPADHLVRVRAVSEVASAIERMEVDVSEIGRVTDVMQPPGRLDQAGQLALGPSWINHAGEVTSRAV
jgi:hypothetical protein